MTGLELWTKFFTLIKSITGDVDVAGKGTLQEQIDDCFTSASNGKKVIAAAITGKGVNTTEDAEYDTMADNIAKIKTTPTLQAKSASLSTSAQTIKPDTEYDGLSQVSVPAVTGNAGIGDVLSGKTFNSATAGIAKTGTLADKTGVTDYSATASLDAANNRLKMQVPAAGKYSTANYLYAAYSTIASLVGLTAAKLVKGNTILGITGSSNNMDTSGGDATAAQILSGKKACVKGSLVTGTMANKAGVTVDAGAATQDDDYTYLDIPAAGYYDTASKVRTLNSNLGGDISGNISLMEVSATLGRSFFEVPAKTKITVNITSLSFIGVYVYGDNTLIKNFTTTGSYTTDISSYSKIKITTYPYNTSDTGWGRAVGNYSIT